MGHGVLSPVCFPFPVPFFYFGNWLESQPPRGSERGRRSKQTAGLEIDGGALVLEERGFRSQHFKVAGDAAL